MDIKPNNDLHGDIIPSATNTYSLGSSSYRYTRGYINNLYTDYMYPSANSCTIGDANNPYLCMYMTTTNAYSDYAVVNKAYLKKMMWLGTEGLHFKNSSQANFDTFINSTVPSGVFTVQNYVVLTTPTGGGNNSLAFGWLNSDKTWGYVILFDFNTLKWGHRNSASAFTWKTLS